MTDPVVRVKCFGNTLFYLMEVDLQNCSALFSLLSAYMEYLQKYVESLFRSPLVSNGFCALHLSSGFFIALHSFPLYGLLGNLNIMVWLLMPIILTYFMPLFWGLHFDTLLLLPLFSTRNNWKSLHRTHFLTVTAMNIHSAWQLGLLLHLLWNDGLGLLLIRVHTQSLLTYAEARVSLSGLLLTCAGSLEEVRTCATIRPLLGWVYS